MFKSIAVDGQKMRKDDLKKHLISRYNEHLATAIFKWISPKIGNNFVTNVDYKEYETAILAIFKDEDRQSLTDRAFDLFDIN